MGILKALAGKLLPWFIGEVVDLADKASRGEDITHHWVMEKIPEDLRTVALDIVKTEQRRAAGLPT